MFRDKPPARCEREASEKYRQSHHDLLTVFSPSRHATSDQTVGRTVK
jgi:hypothetical protein